MSFQLGRMAPYTGEDSWWNRSSNSDVENISEKLQIGKHVVVRYRRDNPAVNKLDHGSWTEVEDL